MTKPELPTFDDLPEELKKQLENRASQLGMSGSDLFDLYIQMQGLQYLAEIGRQMGPDIEGQRIAFNIPPSYIGSERVRLEIIAELTVSLDRSLYMIERSGREEGMKLVREAQQLIKKALEELDDPLLL